MNAQFEIPAPSCTSCKILGKLLNLSLLHVPYQDNGIIVAVRMKSVYTFKMHLGQGLVLVALVICWLLLFEYPNVRITIIYLIVLLFRLFPKRAAMQNFVHKAVLYMGKSSGWMNFWNCHFWAQGFLHFWFWVMTSALSWWIMTSGPGPHWRMVLCDTILAYLVTRLCDWLCSILLLAKSQTYLSDKNAKLKCSILCPIGGNREKYPFNLF